MWRRVALFPVVPLLVAGLVVAVHPASRPAIRATRPGAPTGARLAYRGGDPRGATALERLPLAFVQNRGQTDHHVAYYAVRGGTSFFFTSTGLTLARTEGRQARWSVKVGFPGAATVRPVGIDRAPGVISYFQGPQSAWHTGLPTFSAVAYRNLWPGIDLVYRGGADGLEYSFLVHPGANPGEIGLAYRGVTGSAVSPDGGLHLATPVGDLVDRAPLAYQRIDGRRVAVASSYRLAGTRPMAGFSLGAYDRSRTLVIDPYLIYSGFIGGAGSDLAFGVDVDAKGNAYVVGFTNSTEKSFPEKVGPDLTENDNGQSFDAFVAKVNPAGTSLVYCGYIGGIGDDEGYGVAVGSDGAAYVTGVTASTEATFPVKVGPDLTNGAGNVTDARDAFIAKVDPTGTSLDYAGYIGGDAYDSGRAVAVDGSGRAYVQGVTESRRKADGFPAVVGPDLSYNGHTDAYVGRVKADGSGFEYLGYLGGTDLDSPGGIAADTSGDAYAVGYTWSDQSEGFPLVGGGDTTLAGFQDAYVTKVKSDGSGFAYSEYIGGVGSLEDSASSVAVDKNGDAFVTGRTDADQTTFPVLVGPDTTYNGGLDAFVAEVNPAGNGFVYSGYVGGANDDEANGIAIDSKGNAYIAGDTQSDETTFPVMLLPDLTYHGILDAFVAEVAQGGGKLLYAGYVGGTGDDDALDNAVPPLGGRQVIVGRTNGGTFPRIVGPDLSFNGNGPPLGFDAFVSKVFAATDANMSVVKTGPSSVVLNDTFDYTITATNFGAATATGVKVTDVLPSQVQFVSATPSQGTCSLSGSTVTCTIGTLAAMQAASIDLQVQAVAGGSAVNTAQVSSASVDPFSGNNKSTVTTTITS